MPNAIHTAYERVLAGDIAIGDRVARARSHPFVQVAQINVGNSAVRLLNEHGATIARPLKTAKWWKIEEEDPNPTGEACGVRAHLTDPCDRGLGHPGAHRDAAGHEWDQAGITS